MGINNLCMNDFKINKAHLLSFLVLCLCFGNLLLAEDHKVSEDIESVLLLKPNKEGLVKYEELESYLLSDDLKGEVKQWLMNKSNDLKKTKKEYQELVVDDAHRKLLQYIKGYISKRKWADFELGLGIGYDSTVAKTRDGEINISGTSSVSRMANFSGDWKGRWLPWGKSLLSIGLDHKDYERTTAKSYGYTSFGLGYGHVFQFFRPNFYKYSKFNLEGQYVVSDAGSSKTPFYWSLRPSFKLMGSGASECSFKPDSIKLEMEVRDYKGSSSLGLTNQSLDVTGLKLESEWVREHSVFGKPFMHYTSLFVRNYEADSEEHAYSTVSLASEIDLVAGPLLVIPRCSVEKNFGQNYNLLKRDDLVFEAGMSLKKSINKKYLQLILDFEWEDRQSSHSSFDYSHEMISLGCKCRW